MGSPFSRSYMGDRMAAPLPAERGGGGGGGISLFRDFYASPSRALSYRGLREKTPCIPYI